MAIRRELPGVLQKIIARTVDPATVDSCSVTGGNLPELIESAEVIQPNVIAVARRPTQALNPPLISTFFHDIPAVERVSPALSGLAEEIGRNSGNHFRSRLPFRRKSSRCVDIRAVVVDEDRDIANNANISIRAITAQIPPLLVKAEL